MVELSTDESREPDVSAIASGEDESAAGAVTGPDRVDIEYFTDPLCCWSWALEPELAWLRDEFGCRLQWRYRMGGMIAGWDRYHDPVNVVSRPLQMAPLWFQARHITGVEIDDRIWFEDPPDSSYPACIAVKAAELQSPTAGELYLRQCREAVLRKRKNIARQDVLLSIAEELGAEAPDAFDAEQFARDLDGRPARDSFREDLRLVRYQEIGRFPTLVLRRAGAKRAIAIVGYRPFHILRAAVRKAMEQQEPQAQRIAPGR